ncbi:hypothetical protein TNIN_228741 [Trichonephila inaurata madagascariensis]|uniref:Uncharacterized protein n=1 Tax=Trichonephila inaurata madagascariensis TaxID=2747483 RepID=A0A8X6XL57_9ARAC|nr:hypothetical protein TNIN_228741 [Trichonephila inaurata madagascariensis]
MITELICPQMETIITIIIQSSPSRFVITDVFIYDNQQSVRELINLGDSYAVWSRKHSIARATNDEYADTSAELGNIHTALLRQGKDELNAVPSPQIHRGPGRLHQKVKEQRKHLTFVDSTLKEILSSDNPLGLSHPSIKKIGKKNPFLPPSASQTSNSGQGPPPTAESSDSEIEDEEAGKSNSTAVGTPIKPYSTKFDQLLPPDNWSTLILIGR